LRASLPLILRFRGLPLIPGRIRSDEKMLTSGRIQLAKRWFCKSFPQVGIGNIAARVTIRQSE
jgi:hypothetical protein